MTRYKDYPHTKKIIKETTWGKELSKDGIKSFKKLGKLGNKLVKVREHKRYDPRIGKQVEVDSYDREIKVKPFKKISKGNSETFSPKRMTGNNIGYIQYKILEEIKLNDHYNIDSTLDDLYDELSFNEEDEKVIRDMVENLRSQGLLTPSGLKLTKDGNRVFWDFAMKNDQDNENLEILRDYPKKPLEESEQKICMNCKKFEKNWGISGRDRSFYCKFHKKELSSMQLHGCSHFTHWNT